MFLLEMSEVWSEDIDSTVELYRLAVFALILIIWMDLLAMTKQKTHARIKLDVAVDRLLRQNNDSGIRLLAYINLILRQYHLDGRYDPKDIFNDAYLRALAIVDTGKEIGNPVAWFKITARNIIRERSRKHAKWQDFEPEIVDQKQAKGQGFFDPFEDISRQEILASFLASLNPFESEMLSLRYFDDLDWQAVRNNLQTQGYGDIQESTLRKRHQRVLNQFRQVSHVNSSLSTKRTVINVSDA